jgi:DNA-3-methyladenine glycosylase
MLPRSFYARGAIELAPALIGKILMRRIEPSSQLLSARIVETEAYVGPHDLASHSSRGRTARTEVMFGPPGHAYVYFIYGMYHMLNIVAAHEDDAQAVLIRAAEPVTGFKPLAGFTGKIDLAGPGKLARALHLTRADNGLDLTGPSLYLRDDPAQKNPPRIGRAPRVGVDYAKHWKHRLLRFYDRDSSAVSKPDPRKMTRRQGEKGTRLEG